MQLVSVPLAGVPRLGATRVGLVANTSAPEPVSSLTADARLADDGVAKKVATPVPKPLMPVETGRPVALVSVPLDGVPSAGVVRVGDVSVLLVSVSVPARVASVPVVGSVTVVSAVAVRLTSYPLVIDADTDLALVPST